MFQVLFSAFKAPDLPAAPPTLGWPRPIPPTSCLSWAPQPSGHLPAFANTNLMPQVCLPSGLSSGPGLPDTIPRPYHPQTTLWGQASLELPGPSIPQGRARPRALEKVTSSYLALVLHFLSDEI